MKFKTIFTAVFYLIFIVGNAQNMPMSDGFRVIPLGVKGGLDESNLSAYLVAAGGIIILFVWMPAPLMRVYKKWL